MVTYLIGYVSAARSYLVLTFLVASAVLVVTGAEKLLRPNPTARVLTSAGLASTRAAAYARGLGSIEVGVGVLGLSSANPATTSGVASLYLIFAAFLAFLVKLRPGVRSCGCLGAKDLPPNLVHAAVNLGAAGISVAAGLFWQGSAFSYVRTLGLAALPVAAVMAATVWSIYGLIAYVPNAMRSYVPEALAPRRGGRARQAHIDEVLREAGIGPDDPSLWGGIRIDSREPEAIEILPRLESGHGG